MLWNTGTKKATACRNFDWGQVRWVGDGGARLRVHFDEDEDDVRRASKLHTIGGETRARDKGHACACSRGSESAWTPYVGFFDGPA